ncbi:homeobox protein 26 [Striga hermonthica]|uniref:Homeobox protein 26 n=1 Tax=Striga hermonthica TaxID=68872 RepID=A0A9N7RRA8_STRHE|nr:homeobox protein 26 [Striga hermonthica]
MHRECLHNHGAPLRRYILDGCLMFEPKGPNGSPEFLQCAACGCHRNFHRRVEVTLPRFDRAPPPEITDLQPRAQAPQQNPPQQAPQPEIANLPPNGPQIHRMVNQQVEEEEEPAVQRRRMTSEQKVRLREIVESKNWKMFKEYSPEEVAQVCAEVGIPRLCLKNWISILRREREVRMENADQD